MAQDQPDLFEYAEDRKAGGLKTDATAFASLGPGQLRGGRREDAIDGRTPSAFITARSVEDVQAAVSEAARQSCALIVTGGGTKSYIGNLPEAFDLRLSMTGLGDITDQSPEDMTVTVEAGATMARLGRALAKSGQRFAVDCSTPDASTVGGMAAANSTGGLRHGFGSWRDLVLGMTVVDGTGRAYSCGGRVVKNVAGFDLPRLFVGSWGSLGVITELTLRTHPLPECCETLYFDFEDSERLDQARMAALNAPLPLTALDLGVDTEAGRFQESMVWTMAVRIEGTEEEVRAQRIALENAAGRTPSEITDDWQSPAHGATEAEMIVRIGALPSTAVKLSVDLIDRLGPHTHNLFVGGHLGDGTVRASMDLEQPSDAASVADHVRELVEQYRGFCILEKAPAALKHGGDVWGGEPTGFAIMKALKARFDPRGALAPGRMAGRL